MNPNVAIAIAFVVGFLVGVVVMYAAQQAKTARLKKQFGPEYGRVIADTGDRHRTEAVLEERHRRVRKLTLRPLSATEKANFQEGWRSVQARFVDDPAIALTEADVLIGKVMAAEGYPVTEFEQRAEDISVDHPIVVENYRDGHAIELRNQQGRASTEDLRKAMINYRRLFEELVGLPEGEPAERIRL
ncbi:MAG TPA: hypothetical protein VMH20_14490 [Verrucomicrobiae bacterium]|nr:hypothetical protein [Verrucomicrobiae bacterium]